jgi:hypothetical protein
VNIIKVNCIHVWKCHNEIHYIVKSIKKEKDKQGGGCFLMQKSLLPEV